VNDRRADQLTRAAKLRANVSVLLGVGQEAPEVIELSAVKRTQLERSSRVLVQIVSWIDRKVNEFPVLDDPLRRASEEDLALVVDAALDWFEWRRSGQARASET
jgi:hypothetical protein